MMRLFACAMMLGMLGLTWAAGPGATAKKKSSTSSSARNSGARSSRKGSVKSGSTWRNRQLVPTRDRYREIQQALASKGFLRPEDVTGVWGQTSIEGLRQFQAAQKIEVTGKINSLSLIAMGLGPKRETPPAKTPVPPAAE